MCFKFCLFEKLKIKKIISAVQVFRIAFLNMHMKHYQTLTGCFPSFWKKTAQNLKIDKCMKHNVCGCSVSHNLSGSHSHTHIIMLDKISFLKPPILDAHLSSHKTCCPKLIMLSLTMLSCTGINLQQKKDSRPNFVWPPTLDLFIQHATELLR